jgi:hypothetical protein
MWWWLLVFSCSQQTADSLGVEGQSARAELAQALVARIPAQVGPVARRASAWEGKDPALDRLLGDALANVLIKPEAGLALLQAHPAPDDPTWSEATLNAAMRTGSPTTITKVWAQLGRPAVAAGHPVVQQVVLRARRDLTLGYPVLEDVARRCELLDAQPQIGRQVLDLPALAELAPAARALGAHGVVLGRAARRSDPDPAAGAGPWNCGRRVLLEAEWPEPMLKSFVIGATDGNSAVFLDIKLQAEGPWAYAASESAAGARWIRAAGIYRDAGGGERGVAAVQLALGQGLAAR